MTANARRFQDLALTAGQVFTPATPVDERSLFAGRDRQVQQVVDAINQKGQHAIIFGERGVGKTSLANVLSSFLTHPSGAVLAPHVNCDTQDTFESVWRKTLEHIELTRSAPGFDPQRRMFTSADLLGSPAAPDGVRRVLTVLSQSSLPILIIDEFDRLRESARKAFADTVKTLCDHSVGATLVLVGVADAIEQLIQEHQSIDRALVQIRMPRMSRAEIELIVQTGTARLGMTVTNDALNRISLLSQGLPHYTHLLCLHATRATLENQVLEIDDIAVDEAINRAIEGAQHSIRSAWNQAIRSARKDNLFTDVLLACALAETDEMGFFAAQDVRAPLRTITGKQYDIPTYAQHLNEFSDAKRGSILFKTGQKRLYRYRFVNPLMQPFVIMNGFQAGRITNDLISRLPAR